MSRNANRTSAGFVNTIGIDIGKNTFHLIGFDEEGAIVLRQTVHGSIRLSDLISLKLRLHVA